MAAPCTSVRSAAFVCLMRSSAADLWHGVPLWCRFRAFSKHDFNDGCRKIFATTVVSMTGKTCNQRASVILQLMCLIPDLLSISVIGQVRRVMCHLRALHVPPTPPRVWTHAH